MAGFYAGDWITGLLDTVRTLPKYMQASRLIGHNLLSFANNLELGDFLVICSFFWVVVGWVRPRSVSLSAYLSSIDGRYRYDLIQFPPKNTKILICLLPVK